MNMGFGTQLLMFLWMAGIVFPFIGFIDESSRILIIAGFPFLIVAIIWTCYLINSYKREKAEKLDEQIKREREEKKLALLEGLEKFHQMDVDGIRKYQEGIVALRQLGEMMQQSVYQEKKKDWAVLGGIAEGIAGPTAGIVTAANAIKDNAKIEAENAARREWGAKQKAFYQDMASQAEKESPTALSMTKIQEKYKAVLAWSPTTLFSLINFRDTKIDIDEKTGAVLVSTSWWQSDRSVCIDGALRAKLYTDSGQCAGCAYLVFPKMGTAKLFRGNLSGICASPKKSTGYTVRIEPVDLWELKPVDLWERYDLNISGRVSNLKSDNLTDDEHRKFVADCEARFLSELRN